MTWTIEQRDGAVLVSMRSNPVNKMNEAFFDDLHEALDRIEVEHPRKPLVLTADGSTFSAGLDFEEVFPRFERANYEEIARWFARFRGSILRLFELPRRTVAAVNGNAYAGGLILALCCDHRIAARTPGRFTLNEVAIGIPMPGVYVEIVRHTVGTRVATELMLDCRLYGVEDALTNGFVHSVVPPEELVQAAISQARAIGDDAFSAYRVSKAALLAPTLERIYGPALPFDEAAMRAVMHDDSKRAQATALAKLKQHPRK
ncbi:MAG: enoyl-CoA hydratase/isomerase family protein [Pseudomonadota bacterium]